MHVRRTRSTRPAGWLCIAAALAGCTLALAACGHSAKPPAAVAKDCGTGLTAAKVPVEVEIDRGQVSCKAALTIEASYAKAIQEGKAPGNGGGGPVPVNGWTCVGFPTPQLLKTGDASKCAKGSAEILAILKTPS
jgi:hypothetical protein